MDLFRLRHTIGMFLHLDGFARAKYIRKHHVFRHVGDNCMVMFRKIPLYSKLISFGNNVWIASNVTLVTHDVIHHMLNYYLKGSILPEFLGCIDIKDNVFVGANSTILPNVSIGPNTIVAAGSVVNKSIGSGVYAGVPAKYICSFDDFIEKRKQYSNFSNEYVKHGGLSDKTVQACWDRYNRM